jgi:hypothetical protein
MVWPLFFCGGKGRFCWGFWKNQSAERGFLMVRLWFFGGKSWCVDGHFFGAKKHATFLNYFFRGVPCWGFPRMKGQAV